MVKITKTYDYKSVAELNASEIEKFIDYVVRDNSLISLIVQDIYENIAFDCKYSWISDGNNFKCDNIYYNDYDRPTGLGNLEYNGKLPSEEDISDRFSIGVFSVNYPDGFGIHDNYTDGIEFELYATDNSSNVDELFHISDFVKSAKFQKTYGITEQEYESVAKYIEKFLSKFNEDADSFETNVDGFAKAYEKILDVYSPEFREHCENFSFGLYFDENGNIADHDFSFDNE